MSLPPPTPPPPPLEPAVIRARRPIRRDGGALGAFVTFATVLAVLALLAATAAGRELLAPPAALTVVVLFLPYLYAAGAVWAFALWSVFPDRRAPPLILAVMCVVGFARWGPGCASGGPAPPGEALSLMSWNVRRLWGGEQDGGDPTGCVVQAIRKADPDVLDLLEVSAEDVATLAAALDLDCAHTPYFQGGGPKTGGAAVCVRKGRWNLKHGAGQRFVDTDDWSYLFAELERDGAVFNLLAVHLVPYRVTERDLRRTVSQLWGGSPEAVLDLGDRSQKIIRSQADQSAALVDRVSRLKDPTVIAGDFNSTRDTALHVALRKHLTDTWERAGGGFGGTIRVLGALPLRVDFIYSTPAFYVADSEIPPVDCSDHRPVVTRLVLPK